MSLPLISFPPNLELKCKLTNLNEWLIEFSTPGKFWLTTKHASYELLKPSKGEKLLLCSGIKYYIFKAYEPMFADIKRMFDICTAVNSYLTSKKHQQTNYKNAIVEVIISLYYTMVDKFVYKTNYRLEIYME
jgi:hypothetical protein